jgi:integrase
LALSFFTKLIFLSQKCNFPEKPVSEMMGHSTAQVTEHYLASLDMEKTWEINEGII